MGDLEDTVYDTSNHGNVPQGRGYEGHVTYRVVAPFADDGSGMLSAGTKLTGEFSCIHILHVYMFFNYPCVFRRKKGIIFYRSPSVRPSVHPAAIPINFSYTIDARVTYNMDDIPMHTDVENVFEIFLRLEIIQILMILPKNAISL